MVLSALFIIFADVMRIDIITVLPEMLEGFFNESILARAQKKGLAEIHLHNLRDYTLDKWKRVDDYPYGGSAGMVMQCEPIDRCIAALKAEREYDDVIYVSPDGETFNQKIANEMSMQGNLIILCGHYKGIDQRVRDHLITREISVGDYVLTGGELAAAIISDAVIRLVPGVISDEQSALSDCFQDDILAAPIYTRPADYKGWKVPEILLSGNEAKIRQWEFDQSLSGPAILPPDWVFGPWISANHWNTQKETEKQIELLKKYQFPATVLVLEAWSDEATFYIFNGAKYKEKPDGGPFAVGDFDYSESAYWPNPQEMIEKLHKAGLHLVLWQVPVYKQQGDDEIRNHQNDLDREDAVKHSLCIHNLDGTPYKIPEGHWFPGSMIPDFTNPETCRTWFGKRQYLLDMGVDGFKTDGGEFVCTDEVSFYDGSTGKESRNCYPQQYTKAYTKFLGDNHVLFSRAGYMGQHTTPCHWGGDQQSTNDELRHVLSAGLSAALSGILFWGFDLAGFAGPLPTLDLYRRATMLACFTPIMQWHSEPDGGQFKELMPGGEGNNERSPWNMAAVYNSPEFVTEMRFWHWLRMNLQPYLMATAFRCAAEKVPMMRPLVYEWPRDKAARQVEDEFLLGDAILVAPLLEENQTAREVYLPEGEWYAFFTGKCYHGCQTISTTADMKFPVFIRGGYAVPLHADGMDSLGNPVSQNLNSKLILLVAGAAGKSTFTTNKSVLTCEWKNEKVRVEGTGAETVQIHHFC